MDAFGLPNYTGTKHMASDARTSSESVTWIKTMKNLKKSALKFVVCINNEDYLVSLELHKIYRVLPDKDAAMHGDLRIIDESGEDYLYSAERFVLITLPQAAKEAMLADPHEAKSIVESG